MNESREVIARIVQDGFLKRQSWTEIADAIIAATPGRDGVAGEPFQARVEPWMRECFGDVIPFDKVERGDRLVEEVFELLQSGGYDPARILALRDYVWNRPVGEPAQEVGGVMVTLAAYCLAFGLDMHEAGETELARIWTKVEQIRAKQATKPVGSALPIALPSTPPGEGSGLDLDAAHKRLTAASRKKSQVWEQPHAEARGVVVDPADLRALIAERRRSTADMDVEAHVILLERQIALITGEDISDIRHSNGGVALAKRVVNIKGAAQMLIAALRPAGREGE